MEKNVRVAYGKLTATNFRELQDLQGELKDLPDENYEKLKTEILETGFSFAPHAWNSPKQKKIFLIDGHQRIKALRKLSKEGYKIPPIPVVMIEAKNFEEAKRKVLQGVSQYGVISNQGLKDFWKGMKLSLGTIETNFNLPNFDFEQFRLLAEGEGLEDTMSNKKNHKDLAQKLEGYINGEIRRMVLYFSPKEYSETLELLGKVKEILGTENLTQILMQSLERVCKNAK